MLLFTSCCFSSKRNFYWIVLGNRKENISRLYDLPERCSIAAKQVAFEIAREMFFDGCKIITIEIRLSRCGF
jgi:hypothetical protein